MAETPQFTPALTEEEWKAAIRDRAGFAAAMQKAWGDDVNPENDHALAALCLYQQPFGFTHLELKALTLLVNSRRAYICSDDPYDETDYEPLAQSALAKIRALLPPDSTP